MSEAIALVSVSVSGAVAVSGVIATAGGATRQRRWQSREERTIDLRTALENGSQSFGRAMFITGEAFAETIASGSLTAERRAELSDAQHRVVLACNQIGVRRGPRSAEYVTYMQTMTSFTTLLAHLYTASVSGVDSARAVRFSEIQAQAAERERDYLDATAKTLGWLEPLPRWRPSVPFFRGKRY
jgi:hypothetical protein